MLTFKFDDLKRAYEGCLDRFSKNLLITAALHSVREIFLSGQDEYRHSSGYRLGVHNALGFRILAANILAVMLKSAIDEKCNLGVGNELIQCNISGMVPNYEESKKTLQRNEENLRLCELDEPALRKWSEVFRIPFSTNVDINVLYYTNQDE